MKETGKLEKIGLSMIDIQVYKALVKYGSLIVSRLATELAVKPNGLYRVLKSLETLGFVQKIGGFPLQYQARPLDIALESYFDYQRIIMGLAPASELNPKQTMKVLTGRIEIFEMYMQLLTEAKTDSLTISIGEKVPQELYEVTKKAIDRGVKNYLIFQKHDRQNDMWLKRWKVQDSSVRILTGEGYHLNIIDNGYAILSSSNLRNTNERTAVLISSPSIVVELRKYFFQQWQLATPLGLLK